MKRLNLFYTVIFAGIAIMIFDSCNDAGNKQDLFHGQDTLESVDSTMSVHHKDPATAFPQPPVTGTMKDSVNEKDSMKEQ